MDIEKNVVLKRIKRIITCFYLSFSDLMKVSLIKEFHIDPVGPWSAVIALVKSSDFILAQVQVHGQL